MRFAKQRSEGTPAGSRWINGSSSRQWLIGFVILFGMIALWSLATPKYAAPDEPAQAIKAAATARWEFLGAPAPTAGTVHSPTEIFRVPRTLINGANPACFAFQPRVSAGCAAPWHGYSGLTKASTYVGRYPPLYYLIVGLPSLLTRQPSMLIWMRLVSAALSAIFLAAAFVCATKLRRGGRWAALGVAVALTPMELFLAAVINPSGLEISSALCLWSAGLCLATGPAPRSRRWLICWAAISAAVLVQLRGLSPLLVALIGAALAIVAGRSLLARLWRRGDVRFGLVLVGICSIFSLVWIFGQHSLWVAPSGAPVNGALSDLGLLRRCLDEVGLGYRGYIGEFGWLDTLMPTWLYLLWGAAIGLLVLGGLLSRQRRLAALLLALIVVVIALPTLLAYSQAHDVGIVGQPRYTMPLAVGIPLLGAGMVARRASDVPGNRDRTGKLVIRAVAAALAAMQAICFVLALHRYRSGVGTPIFGGHASWNPPAPWLVLVAAFVLLDAALAGWWLTTGRNAPPRANSTPPIEASVSS